MILAQVLELASVVELPNSFGKLRFSSSSFIIEYASEFG